MKNADREIKLYRFSATWRNEQECSTHESITRDLFILCKVNVGKITYGEKLLSKNITMGSDALESNYAVKCILNCNF